MQYKVNVSIDDISPHPRSSTKVLKQCYKLIDAFDNIKITLFIPVSYWRTIPAPSEACSPEPYQIHIHEEFCDEIRSLPQKNFEIAYHGFYHGIPGKSNNDEFKYLDYDRAKEVITKMFKVAELANLKDIFKPILRPPAWRMSPDSFDACRDYGVELLALADLDYAIESYGGKDKEFDKVSYSNCFPPIEELKMYEKTGIVYHACEWDRNYLDDEKTEDLINFLNKEIDNIEFCFQDKMV